MHNICSHGFLNLAQTHYVVHCSQIFYNHIHTRFFCMYKFVDSALIFSCKLCSSLTIKHIHYFMLSTPSVIAIRVCMCFMRAWTWHPLLHTWYLVVCFCLFVVFINVKGLIFSDNSKAIHCLTLST